MRVREAQGEESAAKRSKQAHAPNQVTPIWMEPPQWLYLPASGIMGGMRLQEGTVQGVGVHGGSGAGDQTAAAALISGRGLSPGREGGAIVHSDVSASAARASRRRDGEEKLRGANAAISISLSDHAERVSLKAQRIKDGIWPIGEAAAVPAREKLAALRERVRARAAGISGSSSTARSRPAASAPQLRGHDGCGTAMDISTASKGGDLVRNRGEGRQLVNELPLDLRTLQTIEVSQIHSASGFGDEAGGASTSDTGFAADGSRAADGVQWSAGGGVSQQGSGGGVGSSGTAIRTARALAASHTAWHTVVTEAAPQ